MASTSPEIAPYSTLDRVVDGLGDLRARVLPPGPVPTLMHITHAKAGSTWVTEVLERLFGPRCALRGDMVSKGLELAKYTFEPGRVYRAMFITRDEFLAHAELREIQRFVIIRDLRDTVVSNYFSVKVSHATDAHVPNMDRMLKRREILQGLTEEEGLIYLLENVTPRSAAIQHSWVGHGEIVLHYEEMIGDPQQFFRRLFLEQLQLPVSATALDRAIRRTHFQTVYGRKLGEEKVESHGRRGLPGDWKNHFTPAVRKKFVELYGSLLVETGYEKDDSWAEAGSGA